jgi:predicted ATPase
LRRGSEDLKITHVKICNYRNLRNIDIGLAETVAIIGENIVVISDDEE